MALSRSRKRTRIYDCRVVVVSRQVDASHSSDSKAAISIFILESQVVSCMSRSTRSHGNASRPRHADRHEARRFVESLSLWRRLPSDAGSRLTDRDALTDRLLGYQTNSCWRPGALRPAILCTCLPGRFQQVLLARKLEDSGRMGISGPRHK